jgi:hypothetical protein
MTGPNIEAVKALEKAAAAAERAELPEEGEYHVRVSQIVLCMYNPR